MDLQSKTFLILISQAFICLLQACRAGDESRKDYLIVGMELSYPPFEMTEPRGEPSRISVDLARELGKALGKRIFIRNMSFDGLIPSLKTGKIDPIISSMTATPERSRSIDFSDPVRSRP